MNWIDESLQSGNVKANIKNLKNGIREMRAKGRTKDFCNGFATGLCVGTKQDYILPYYYVWIEEVYGEGK